MVDGKLTYWAWYMWPWIRLSACLWKQRELRNEPIKSFTATLQYWSICRLAQCSRSSTTVNNLLSLYPVTPHGKDSDIVIDSWTYCWYIQARYMEFYYFTSSISSPAYSISDESLNAGARTADGMNCETGYQGGGRARLRHGKKFLTFMFKYHRHIM